MTFSIINTVENLEENMQRAALFSVMDLRSLETDSDETYPNVRTNAELHSGLVRVHKMNRMFCAVEQLLSSERREVQVRTFM